MFSFLSILLLQFAFTYKILFIPRTYRLFTQKKNEILMDPKISIDSNISYYSISKNITQLQIDEFIDKIKMKTPEYYDKEIWDDGEVEW